MENELDKKIGTKEIQKLSAGSVLITEVKIEPPKEGSAAKIVNFYCKHADKEEPIKISSIKVKKVQGNNETISLETLWYNLDEDENIRKNSQVAQVMNFYKKDTLKSFEGSSVDTEQDAKGYLVIKAY